MSIESDFEEISPDSDSWVLLDSETLDDREIKPPASPEIDSDSLSQDFTNTGQSIISLSHNKQIPLNPDSNLSAGPLAIDVGDLIHSNHNCGLRPLHVASSLGQLGSAKELLASGAVVDDITEDGDSPLHLAVRSGHSDLVELLLANGADINLRNRSGSTALHIAVERNHVKIVKQLLERGADPSLLDNSGYSPLDLASKLGHDHIVNLLSQSTMVQFPFMTSANDRPSGDLLSTDAKPRQIPLFGGKHLSPLGKSFSPLPALRLPSIVSTSPTKCLTGVDLKSSRLETRLSPPLLDSAGSSFSGSPILDNTPPESSSMAGNFLKSLVIHSLFTMDNFESTTLLPAIANPTPNLSSHPRDRMNRAVESSPFITSTAWDDNRLLAALRPKPVPKSVSENVYNMR